MDIKLIISTFALLFVAELGDKTQLAVITLTARTHQPWPVFIGAVLGLTAVTALGILAGALITRWIPIEWVSRAAAVAFITIGGLMLWGKL